jgi:hypothetical protein
MLNVGYLLLLLRQTVKKQYKIAIMAFYYIIKFLTDQNC